MPTLNPNDAPDGYVAVESRGCNGCAFAMGDTGGSCRFTDDEPETPCADVERKDMKTVIFVKRAAPTPEPQAADVELLAALDRWIDAADMREAVSSTTLLRIMKAGIAEPAQPAAQAVAPDWPQKVDLKPDGTVRRYVWNYETGLLTETQRGGWVRYADHAAALAAAAPVAQPLTPLTDEQKRAMWRATTFRGSGGQIDWYMQGIVEAERAHGISSSKGGD